MNSDTADAAVDNFLRAAGTLRYIGEHFTHPPSFDLAPHTLEALTALFLVSNLHILDTLINLVIEWRSSQYLVETEISIITYKNTSRLYKQGHIIKSGTIRIIIHSTDVGVCNYS